MKKVMICLLVFFLSALSSLEAQSYCSELLRLAKHNSNKRNYSEAILLLNELDICDAADSFLLERQGLLKKNFQAINQQKISLKISADSLKMLNEQAKQTLERLQKYIEKLKTSTLNQVRSLLDVAKSMETSNPHYALEKIKAVEPFILVAENSEEKNEIKDVIQSQLNKAYHDLGEALKNSIHKQLALPDYPKAVSLLLLLKEVKHFEVDSSNQLWLDVQKQLLGSIEKNLENSNYNTVFEQCNLLANFKNIQEIRACIYLELAFCFTVTQQFEKSSLVLDTLANKRNIKAQLLLAQYKGVAPSQKMSVLKQLCQQFSSGCVEHIQERYLPNHFIPVAHGVTHIDSCMLKVNKFALAKKELSFFEYDLFCLATQRQKPDDNDWGRGNRPAIDLSWYDAIAYCNWRSTMDSLEAAYSFKGDTLSTSPLVIRNINIIFFPQANGYRLPLEAEWQLAAGNFNYGWGNDAPQGLPLGNLCDTSVIDTFPFFHKTTNQYDGYTGTSPVGAYAANSLGFFNLSGNVWEWCGDQHSVNLCTSKVDKNKKQKQESKERILKGGAWSTKLVDALVRTRMHAQPDKHNFSIGFRIAKND